MLQGLSQVEKMLISHVLPIMSVYRLPQGQYGYSGHVLNIPQDVTSFVNTLPRSPAELDVMIVRREGSENSHKDFKVRRSVIVNALQWLVHNNKYYRDVTIDENVISLLPADGDLTSIRPCIRLPATSDQEHECSTDHPDTMSSTFVPLPVRGMTEQQAIQQGISQHHVNWPSTTGRPINEFTTDGYMSCAFPTLFPTGAADYLAPRQRSVTIGNYFKHLMLYQDQWFAKHPRFRYFALNTEMRHS